MKALISLGKQYPPKPNLPSGPGTLECANPIRLSLHTPLETAS